MRPMVMRLARVALAAVCFGALLDGSAVAACTVATSACHREHVSPRGLAVCDSHGVAFTTGPHHGFTFMAGIDRGSLAPWAEVDHYAAPAS